MSAVLCVYPLCYSTVLRLQLMLSSLFICINDGRKKETATNCELLTVTVAQHVWWRRKKENGNMRKVKWKL